jgi:hypothetical protein
MIIIKKEKDYPIIYLRYLKGVLQYVGESQSYVSNRHLRTQAGINDYDIVKVLKACNDSRRRRYWEAVLVCKLHPQVQNILKYQSLVHKRNGREDLVVDHREESYNIFKKRRDLSNEEIIKNLSKAWKIKLIESLELRERLETFKKGCEKNGTT